ncbi:MAG: hypothetical protein JJT96_09620 [Opitutales bacterium]|nr:hypothetical protein [Opitutales bacterium]
MRFLPLCVLLLLLVLFSGGCAPAGLPSPEAMLAEIEEQAINMLGADSANTGELFAWQANWRAERFLEAYEATGDPGYIAAATSYFNRLLEKTHTSPDGYRGWVGPYIYDNTYHTDAHIADAILTAHMLAIAERILVREPETLASYTADARGYVAFARRDVIEKWAVRGTWFVDGPYGYWVTWPMMFIGEDRTERVETHTLHDRLGYQWNKQTEMARIALFLYRITGDTTYREIAARLGRLFKSRLALHEGHYTWNYWEPVYEGDIASFEGKKLVHWVGTHPHRHYQIKEVNFVAEAFHTGLVFDEEDIRRFVRTHDEVMWNGSFRRPQWRNSDAAIIEAVRGSYEPPQPASPHLEHFYRGRPWPPLADFSENIRRLSGLPAGGPVSFERHHARNVEVFPLPDPASAHIRMAAPIPAQVGQGEPLHALIATWTSGPYTLEILDGAGQRILRALAAEEVGEGLVGIEIIDTGDLVPGRFFLRWTLPSGEARRLPFWVVAPGAD